MQNLFQGCRGWEILKGTSRLGLWVSGFGGGTRFSGQGWGLRQAGGGRGRGSPVTFNWADCTSCNGNEKAGQVSAQPGDRGQLRPLPGGLALESVF